MLTHVENTAIGLVYSAMCRRFFGIRFFWNNGKFSVNNPKCDFHYNFITWFLLLFTLSFQITRIPALVQKMDINGLVIHVILVITDGSSVVLKLNLGLYGDRMAHLVNGTLHINSAWGM